MKAFIGLVIWIITLPAAAETVRERVNYHLKSVETAIQKNESEARLKALEANTKGSDGETPVYIPHYGVGDDYNGSPTQFEMEPSADPLESPKDEILRKAASLKSAATPAAVSSSEGANSREAYIEEFKRKAMQKGVRVYIDPTSLEVREVR